MLQTSWKKLCLELQSCICSVTLLHKFPYNFIVNLFYIICHPQAYNNMSMFFSDYWRPPVKSGTDCLLKWWEKGRRYALVRTIYPMPLSKKEQTTYCKEISIFTICTWIAINKDSKQAFG